MYYRRLAEFSQAKIPAFRRMKGACNAISARWLKLILNSKMDSDGVPIEDSQTRMSALGGEKNVKQAAETQNLYEGSARLYELTHDVASLKIKERLPVNIQEANAGIDAALKDSLAVTIKANGLHDGITTQPDWDNIYENIMPRTGAVCGFDVKGNGGHAIGIYRTGGTFFTDFYVFDSNFGEYYCKGYVGFKIYMSFTKRYYGGDAVKNVNVTPAFFTSASVPSDMV